MIEQGGPAGVAGAGGVGGPGGRLVLVYDLAWPDEPQAFDTSYGDPEDRSVALPMLPHHERYLALELATGRVVWTVETPPGSVSSLALTRSSVVTGLTACSSSANDISAERSASTPASPTTDDGHLGPWPRTAS
jgi:hypothetical protein